MTLHLAPSLLTPGQRLLAAVVAASASSALIGVLLLSFHYSSPDVWLKPTPEMLADLAACERRAVPAERVPCKQRLAAAYAARGQGPERLARR